MRVLVLNPGSSSLKSSVIETASIPAIGPDGLVAAASAESLAPLGQVECDWGADATAEWGDPAGDIRSLVARYEAAGISLASLGAVGYRIVQGGATFREPVLVTPRRDRLHRRDRRERGRVARSDRGPARIHRRGAGSRRSPKQDAILSRPGSSPAVLRIVAREDLVVARAAARLVGSPGRD